MRLPNDERVSRRVAKRIKQARLRRRLSCYRVAIDAGVGRRHYALIERGENQPTLATLVKLSAYLRISLAWLLAPLEPNPKRVQRRRQA